MSRQDVLHNYCSYLSRAIFPLDLFLYSPEMNITYIRKLGCTKRSLSRLPWPPPQESPSVKLGRRATEQDYRRWSAAAADTKKVCDTNVAAPARAARAVGFINNLG